MQSNKWPAIEVCILYHRLMIVHLVVTFHTHYFNTDESSQIHEDSSIILPSSTISCYRRAASQTSLYTPDTHTPSPQCWTFAYSPTHMFTWFGLWKSSRLEFHFNLGKRSSATLLDLQKGFYKMFGKANGQKFAPHRSVVTTRNSCNIPTNDANTSIQFENYDQHCPLKW